MTSFHDFLLYIPFLVECEKIWYRSDSWNSAFALQAQIRYTRNVHACVLTIINTFCTHAYYLHVLRLLDWRPNLCKYVFLIRSRSFFNSYQQFVQNKNKPRSLLPHMERCLLLSFTDILDCFQNSNSSRPTVFYWPHTMFATQAYGRRLVKRHYHIFTQNQLVLLSHKAVGFNR